MTVNTAAVDAQAFCDPAQSFQELMSGLRGGITTAEAVLLRRLASEVRQGCIVEVGSFRGKSAVALAMGVRDQGASPPPAIYCIEPHRPFTGFYGGEFGPVDRGAFYETMCQTAAFNEVALINLPSEDVTPTWKQPVGLLFIDGDHRYPGVKRDFDCWDRHVAVGGIVAFDDASDPACGPVQLIGEILESARYSRVEMVGKIVVLRKLRAVSCLARPLPMRTQRILVACHKIVFTGGLLRFNRLGAALKDLGHELAFVVLSDTAVPQREAEFPILTLDEASALDWDAVMVPGGALFSEEVMEKIAVLRKPSFGVRIQHILNDQNRRDGFLKVNKSLDPQVVIFNNTAWPVGSFTDFKADRFHVLQGAVDTKSFRPAAYRSHPLSPSRWVIGGLANKNPEPLVMALDDLPADVVVRLYGADAAGLTEKYSALIDSGRLQLAGYLHGEDLCRFYREVDCVAMTETAAGWANLAAEAMASGVPVICTSHGTAAFAQHEQTALVVDEPTPGALAAAILKLRGDAALCGRLAEQARQVIEAFSWDRYARELLPLIQHDGYQHYLHAPELGLHGKWPLEERLQDMQPLLNRAAGLSVIDFGAAEGAIAREFLKYGAAKVHGFELDPGRVSVANALCCEWGKAEFRAADLSDWTSFHAAHADLIEESYDIVLYLGIQHHLPPGARQLMLENAIRLSRRYFAIRTPLNVYASDGIEALLQAEGFCPLDADTAGNHAAHLGSLRLYERRRS